MKNICFRMSRKALLALVMALAVAFPALAQKITVTGTVYEPEGEPAIGASVEVKGVQFGVATDIDGNFKLQVEPNAVLVVSYVGCDTQEIPVDGRTNIEVHLATNTVAMQELVVVGYGQVKKADATGSVAVVKPDDIEAGIANSAQDLLVGASPGVVVTTNGGNPTGNADIRIRGGASLSANNNPLIVIDGVPQTDQSSAGGTNALSMVNPQNIESMTILKDASATAIYGSRASNGVIIITTKRGKSGRPQVNFAANWHVNTARKTLNMMNTAQLGEIIKKYGSPNAVAMFNQFTPEEGGLPVYDTDWQKEILRTSFSHDYSLSIGGSLGVVPYRVNGSYTKNEGIIKKSDMERVTVGVNVSPKFFNDALSVQANVNGSYVNTNEGNNGAIGGAIAMSPALPVRYDFPTTGSFGRPMFNGYFQTTKSTGEYQENATMNPVSTIEEQLQSGSVYSSNGNIQLDYALYWVPELHFNLNLGYQVSKNNWQTVVDQNSAMAWNGNYKDGAGTLYKKYELQRNTLLDFYINYRKDFTEIESNLDAMVGYSWQRFDFHGNDWTHINTLGLNNDFNDIFVGGVYDLNIDEASADHVGKPYENAPVARWAQKLQLVSFFGRVNYSFKDTYLLTFTLRDDGTSRFSKDNRWGLFPSVALGWKIINMPFLESIRSKVNDMKLRLGWGVTGQQDINAYFYYMPQYTDSYQNGFHYLDPNGSGQWINPLYPNAYNTDIKWEQTTTWNVGLDLAFLNNRITAALDWYKRDTKDLLAFVPVGGVNTSNFMNRNIGSMTNTGFEITVGAKPVVTRDFTWSTSLNVSFNKNKITELTGDAATTMISAASMPSGTGGTLQYHIVGEPAYTFMVYEQVYDDNGDPIQNVYVDQNADGVINDDDLIKFHSRDPKATFTWNNNLRYKNWDFGISLRANVGNYVYNNPKYESSRIYNTAAAQYQVTNLLANTFLFDTESSISLNQSSYFVENASFIRCDNITLGYTFENLLQDKLNLRLFGAVQNPFVITKYKGIDPEVFSGIDNNVYPRPITCTLGLVATF